MVARTDRWLLLTSTKVLLFVAAWLACVILHNVVYALFRDSFGPGGDEPFFFLLAVLVLPAWFLGALVYTIWQRTVGRGQN